MADSTDFQPGEKMEHLGVRDTNTSPLIRYGLPFATGVIVALIAMALL